MRPVLLKIAGLQSYREMQEIDFTRLCDAGVFGIFGPTGSGKSSILDAITLALYGEVERANNGTQGIMNQAENTLTVSFTFELSGASGYERYRVERQFKRNGEVSIHNSVCRFVHIRHDGDVVLADKASDVKKQVQELLGLSMHDFTRAVVLPQGKFAEFLSLKGSERRQMLQRLFHLELYGDQLNSRLSVRVKETDAAIKQIAAEQQGLGDASEQALQEAAKRLEAAVSAARKQRALLAECEAQFQEKKQIREWQEEKRRLAAQFRQLSAAEPEIVQYERQLEKAEQAERLRPYLEEWEAAKQRLIESEAKHAEAERLHAAAKERHEQARRIYDEAAGQLSANEAPSLIRLEQLNQALQLETEIAEQEKAVSELLSRQAKCAEELDEAGKRLQKEQDLRDKAIAKQAELREELKRVEVKAERRQRMQAAYHGKQTIDSLREQAERLSAEQREKAHQAAELQRAMADMAIRQNESGQQLQLTLEKLHAEHRRLHSAERTLNRLQKLVPAAIERHKRLDTERERQRLASLLAEQLSDGSPCPVCGSLHHPAPAAPDVPEEAHSSPADALERLLESTRDLLFGVKRQTLALDALIRQAQQSMPGSAAAEAAAALAPVEQEQSGEGELPEDELFRTFHAVQADAEAVRPAVDQLADDLQQTLRQFAELERQRNGLAAELKAAEAVCAEAERKAAMAASALERAVAEWNARFDGLALERISQDIAALDEMDAKADDIRKRLDISGPFIEQTAERIQSLRERIALLEKEQVQAETERKGVEQLLAEKRRRMAQWAGDEPVRKLIAETEAYLYRLRNDVNEAQLQLEQAQRQLQTAGNAFSAAAEAKETAGIVLEQAEAKWREQLAKTAFASEDEVKPHLLSERQKQQWLQAIKEHREQEKQLRAQMRRLDGLLQGREVSDDEWQEWQERLSRLKREDEDAIRARAKAERDAEDLQSKHAKWKELEKEREKLTQLYARLSKLQSVFRGNAFVEYIAEEQLMQVSRAASERLGQLTGQRYAIEVDSGGGFVIRDDANGGVRRPVSTLSGGETFLTSLALALALSAQIQLRGQYPLEFFFLDEGFGTLDQDLLETVIHALEKLHMDRLTVGVISHVPELRARLPRRLIVQPAEPLGRGSRVFIESM